MTKLTRIIAIAGVLAAMAIAVAGSQTAAASQSTAVGSRACGFVGGETYRHCSTWTHVLIDAQNIWGTTYRNICVGPGDTHLGYLSYWVISYAWYIGKRC